MLSGGIFALLARVACVAMLTLILIELGWEREREGDALRALRSVLAGQVLIILFPLMSAIDSYTDISPGFSLKEVAQEWIWLPYAVQFTCLVKFWMALHAYARGKERNGSE